METATSSQGRCANVIRRNAKSTCGIVYTQWRVTYGASGCVLVNEVHENVPRAYVEANIINVARPHRLFPPSMRTTAFLFIIYTIKSANCPVKWKFNAHANQDAFSSTLSCVEFFTVGAACPRYSPALSLINTDRCHTYPRFYCAFNSIECSLMRGTPSIGDQIIR